MHYLFYDYVLQKHTYNYNAHWNRDNLPSKLGFLSRWSPPTPLNLQSHLWSPCALQSCTLICYQLFFLPSLTPLTSRSAACLLSHSILKTHYSATQSVKLSLALPLRPLSETVPKISRHGQAYLLLHSAYAT